jgi:hypothetical protein
VNSYRSRTFRQHLDALPRDVRRQAFAAYRLFRAEPFHPSLQFKQVGQHVWSVRIGSSHRALGRRTDATVIWYWIGTHADYDQILRRR